ncbi:MOSC domain-containing protein [Thalassovita taeanensis]|uniref:MOSC domain-containing protein n=1 Tax=Thalassovita taeanensis TaxID=657014 RepID=A0A1H9CLM7_9RHOB|nr:MOSC domain-containing protein [Thalassovita taeanensis]SEQ01593.1 hypothetical protein SAMN04488092_103290 [Thalassovita taeanensis]
MTRLTHILRHPVKAIGYEEISGASLTKGRALPFDRHWAVAHAAAKFSGQPEAWHAKMNFLRGVAGPDLMAVQTRLDEAKGVLTLTHPRAATITVDPARDEAELLAWLASLWPKTRPAPSHVVSVPEQAMTDMPEPFIALLGLASNRALSQRMGRDLSIHRWRGNLWIDGWAPFEEFDLIGRRVRIGAAELNIVQRITRCGATRANPKTGREDADTLGTLNKAYGHQDFGVYALVTKEGPIATGDRVEIL